MKYIFKFIQTILWIFFGLVLLLLIQYITATVYIFPENKPFSGDKIFNPYQDINPEHWRKANFQVQSRVWGGITNGRKNTNELIDSTYNFLGYDIIGTSDYMQINDYYKDQDHYIPIYEHGYGWFKRHQICIGAKKINWKDYAFYQNIHHKQDMLNSLRDETELLIIAHPELRDGHVPVDFTRLTNYDGIEILNYFCHSIAQWDSALSTGHYVIGMGNDDVHDITNPDEVGQYCTFVNTATLNGDSVVAAIKAGKGFAANVYREKGDSFEIKKKKHDSIAVLQSVLVRNDTLFVKCDREGHIFRFIGQGGELLKKMYFAPESFYPIKPEDTYVRVEIIFENKNRFYLNPLVRYSGNWPPEPKAPVVDLWKTWVYRILSGATVAFIILNIFIIRKRLKRKN